MKQRNLMVLTLSCALLIIIELGVSIIYSDYIYNPAKGLISINVASQSYNDPNWEPGMENPTSSQNAANLMQEIDDWANSAKAAVIHKNAFSAGCGYSDYSGWLLSALGVSKAKDETTGGKGVYTTEGNSFNDAYTNDNILFPGKADLRILGTFSDEGLPPALAGCDYFYPLTMSEVTDGVYLTDATEIDSLLKLFDDKGYEILHVQRPLSFFALVNRMLSDGFVTRAVLNYTDAHGNRKTKWIATGLVVKGNKKRAEAFLQEQRRSFQEEVPITGGILFADFMEQWLTVIKSSVAVTTFASYSNMVKKVIVPYFRERQITLQELSAKHIQDFYLKELERVSASSVIHYHANIHKALKYAVKLDLISSNPADKIERPRKERFMANFYDADEVNRLFEISKGTKLEIPILFGAFYGMRRSETLGMKWDAIDFERDTITIRHTLTTVALDGKRITVAEDRTKNKSSMRTLPLVPFVKERLLELKAEQEENRRLCGRSYVKDYTGYVCINEIGDIIKPNYVSCGFPKLLEEHGLRRVRYHDLRHSCASLLLANGVPMKQIQEWLGHSDFSTTANIYAHLEYSSKVISADAMCRRRPVLS